MSTFQAIQPKSNLKQVSILLSLLLFVFFARNIAQMYSSRLGELRMQREARVHVQRIEGRWKTVAAALGMLPLPDNIAFPDDRPSPAIQPRPTAVYSQPRYSRFDLRRRRFEAQLELKESPREHVVLLPPLQFAANVRDNPSISLESLAGSFRHHAPSEQDTRTSSSASRRARSNPTSRQRVGKGS